MLNEALFQGELVRLVALDADKVAEHFLKWNRDSEYWRLMAAEPAMPYSKKQIKELIEKELESDKPDVFFFMVQSLTDGRVIGEIGLDGVKWTHGNAFVGISIGEKELWGKGYGTDAMRVILRYAFTELNLQRVSLTVFEYNPRAIRSYEKAGFVEEGRLRKALLRGGRRWDEIFMGVLRTEWEEIRSL